MNNKRRRFKNRVFEHLSDMSRYDNVEFGLLKAYDVFVKNVPGFEKLTTVMQYDICLQVFLIAENSMINQLQSITIIRKKEIEFSEYSLYFRDEDKQKVLHLKEQKLLK